jgi:hypothetical protein
MQERILLLWRQPTASDGLLEGLLPTRLGLGSGFEMGAPRDVGWRSEVRDDVLQPHPELVGYAT